MLGELNEIMCAQSKNMISNISIAVTVDICIVARIDVSAANTADPNANQNHISDFHLPNIPGYRIE